MTDDVQHEGRDDLFAEDDLSDEALDRAAGQDGRYRISFWACQN